MTSQEPSSADETSKTGWLPKTHWSVILAARDSNSKVARQALEQLCRSYWYPLYAFLRRKGHSPEDAQDLTQGFFSELIEKNRLDHVDRAKGKFRCFLLRAIQNHAHDAWDRFRAEKRGGRVQILSLDEQMAEERFNREPADELTAEQAHDRRWAMTVLESAMARLEAEFRKPGKRDLFHALKDFLSAKKTGESYGQVAEKLSTTEDAVRCAVQRMRRRYGELIRGEVAETLASPTKPQVDEEVRFLLSMVGG